MLEKQQILSSAELEAYQRDGFIIPDYRLPPDQLEKLQRLADALVADNPHLINTPMLAPHVPGAGNQDLKSSPEWMDIATDPTLLDIAEQILGPDIVLWGTTLFYKQPLEGPATPWHQDGRNFPIDPLATSTIWIAVGESVASNGCLRVIRGSHASGETLPHVLDESGSLFVQSCIPPEQIDESKAVDVELQPGEMVIFDVNIIHGANANTGVKSRCGFALRLMPATSHYNHDDPKIESFRHERGAAHHLRPLILARGVDRSGLNDFTRCHPTTPGVAANDPQHAR